MLVPMAVRVWTFIASLHGVSLAVAAAPPASLRNPNALEINGEGSLAKRHPSGPAAGNKLLQVMRSEVKLSQAAAPSAVSVATAGGDMAAGLILDPPQYMMWAPHVGELGGVSDAIKDKTKGSGFVGEAVGDAASKVGDVVDTAVDTANALADAINPMNKFCMILNEQVSVPSIQINKCFSATSQESQFVFPEPGTAGPIKLKSDPAKCIGAPNEWWGSSDGKFTPNVLNLTSCSSHVSEHNDTFIMPPVKNGTITGLIAWATHPDMCIDIMDHVEEEKVEQEDGHKDGLIQVSEEPEAEGAEAEKVAAKVNIREFVGNELILAKCHRRGNWTLLASLVPGPAGTYLR